MAKKRFEDKQDLYETRKKRYAPNLNDLSLVILGMAQAHSNNSKALILTDDIDLKVFIEKHLIPMKNFMSHQKINYITNRIQLIHIINYLGYIFRCSSFNDLEKALEFYKKHLEKHLKNNLSDNDKILIYFRLIIDLVSDYKNHFDAKKSNKQD